MKLSIITPVLNGERFIESCIKNVIEQDCKEAEHIIVDGNSTDKTVDIIKRYAREYKHIRYISEPDKGQSDSMNKGIKIAKGNIISFLNVDDFYEQNALNIILEKFKNLPKPTLLVGNLNIWKDDGSLLRKDKYNKLDITDLLLGTGIVYFPANPTCYFYHKSLHDKIGPYDIDQHYTMDVDFLFKAVQNANTKYVNITFGNYRHIKNTKTVDDIKSGQSKIRLNKLLNKYRKKLPFYKKMILRWKLFYHYNWLPFKNDKDDNLLIKKRFLFKFQKLFKIKHFYEKI
ncbi:glycosyltransferase [Candidatus Woesearchaeota archaeon]|nr:glycosyltransferase [Candidatus Woesearchaeota archaeon]